MTEATQTNVFDELKWRETTLDQTEGIEEVLRDEKVTAYIGFDPSAASLHVGSLLPVMCLARLQKWGHTPIAIAGGGTGLIGDPSGKSQERPMLSREAVEANIEGIKRQLEHFLDLRPGKNSAIVINNAEWLTQIHLMDFLRDIGKHFTVNSMIGKESVKRRLETEDGISYTEFSYMLLQAYDFLVLYDRHKCNLQLGGSDQWGNITAGVSLIRKLRGAKAHGLVCPLVTTSTGVKFGKTESGAVWLDPKMTSPYKFYQFWLNTDDRDVIRYLKFFTWLTEGDIAEHDELVRTSPEKREAQRKLAIEVTRIVHGETELSKAEAASQVLFGGEIAGLSGKDVLDIFGDVPSSVIEEARLGGAGLPVQEVFASSGLAASKGEARRLIESGGAYLNNRRVTDPKQTVTPADLIDGQVVVLRKGRREYHLIQVT